MGQEGISEDDSTSNESLNESFAQVLQGRMSRRTLLKGGLAGLVLGPRIDRLASPGPR